MTIEPTMNKPDAAFLATALIAVAIVACAALPAVAQRGDRKGQVMNEVWRDMDVPEAPPLPPEDALKSFKVAPGFRIELVAAEPLVEDPVALAFDADGRIYAVEMRGYMPDVDGKGEDVRNGRIVVLEDSDGDGRMDKSTVFLGELQMPRAVAVVEGGVLVAEPPYLWYCRDTDGDLKCDERTQVYKGFASQGPVEHTDNGLLRGLDGWLYNAKSSKRFQFDVVDGKPVLTAGVARGRGQWGITQDNFGRLYFNSNSSYLSADAAPQEYMLRNPNHVPGTNLAPGIASDQEVHSIRVNPGVNRGYQPGQLREDGRLRSTTATCGPGIYRGDQFPSEYVGDAFVPEPSGNVVAHFRISEKGGRVFARHTTYDDATWGKREFIASTDERFRPVNCYTAPDGTLYIVDMYRGILQHKVFVTSFLRKQILERGLDKPVGMGRIYRIVHESKPPVAPPELSKATSAQLVEHLSHPNGVRRDTAQRLLIERNGRKAIAAIAELATSGDSALGRMHALWALEGMNALDLFTVMGALSDGDEHVRCTAVRMAETMLAREPADNDERDNQLLLLDELLALRGDVSVIVQRQMALSLGAVRLPQVDSAMREILNAHADDGLLRDAVLSGLADRELEFLSRLLADPAWADTAKGRGEAIDALAACIGRQRHPQRIEQLLRLIAGEAPEQRWRQIAMLTGLIKVAQGSGGRKPKPIYYEAQPLAMAQLLASDTADVAKRATQVGELIKWGAPPAPPTPPRPLTDNERKRFDEGKVLFAQTCAGCHMESGLGEEGKAPPLLDSPFLLGQPQRLVRIVLHGVTGPIVLHGREYDMTMPPLQGFNDAQIAAILTYARREWEHAADPVEEATVTQVRAATKERELPWTVEELEKVK